MARLLNNTNYPKQQSLRKQPFYLNSMYFVDEFVDRNIKKYLQSYIQ